LIVSQVLTLYTTPVIYLLLDKLHRKWSPKDIVEPMRQGQRRLTTHLSH
jgi:multidrug efflux pump